MESYFLTLSLLSTPPRNFRPTLFSAGKHRDLLRLGGPEYAPEQALPITALFQVQLENKCLFGHFAVVFGFMCGMLNLSVVQTQQLFLFSTLRTVIASAVRLGNIGPLQVLVERQVLGSYE